MPPTLIGPSKGETTSRVQSCRSWIQPARPIRNGIKGTDKMLLDLRLQYVHRISGERTAGVFWEIYNALNRVNYANPIGARNSADFLRSITADEARSMQIGLRYTF
jgi:hypothetical protein